MPVDSTLRQLLLAMSEGEIQMFEQDKELAKLRGELEYERAKLAAYREKHPPTEDEVAAEKQAEESAATNDPHGTKRAMLLSHAGGQAQAADAKFTGAGS